MKKIDTKKMLRDISEQIIIARKRQNMGQDELAEKAGMSKTSLSKIENCKTNVRVITLIKIAKVLKIKFVLG
jgi:transcriptional regulator with XRE-family HTH domain